MNNIHGMDLNLIRVFDALLDEQNTTRAGERLGLSQSAVSHALTRLRRVLGDELFIRGPQGMHPTPRAMELAEPLRAALNQIDTALSAPRFDPATSEATFVIASSDFYISGLLARLVARIQHIAPHVRLWLRQFNDLNLVDELDRGTLHLAIGRFGRVPSRFRRETVELVQMVWIMRAGHPATGRPLTPEALARHAHVDIILSGQATLEAGIMQDQEGLERTFVTSNPAELDRLLREAGLSRRIGATVPLITAVPPIIAATDMIALVPAALAQSAGRDLGIVSAPGPFPLAPTLIEMLSHNRYGKHPSVEWLRGVLRDLAGDAGATGTGDIKR